MKPILDGHKDIKICQKAKANIRRGKGDHVVVEFHGSHQVIVDRQMGYGLACKVWKWMDNVGILKAAGILAAALGILALAL